MGDTGLHSGSSVSGVTGGGCGGCGCCGGCGSGVLVVLWSLNSVINKYDIDGHKVT